jgi:hypothetical protein
LEYYRAPIYQDLIKLPKELTANSKIDKENNNYAVNIILNSVSESNGSLFNDMTNA